ncbi:MAG: putative metallo-hydrolase YycJ [Chlamydiae bacterium]|nr:putative metallo-hydrolase YycJ [Chlamydiota bacterium]
MCQIKLEVLCECLLKRCGMIGFCPLASGSKGNALYVGTKHTKVLIDAGLSGRMIKKKLEEINVDLADIDAIVITHEHTDHIRGLAVLGCKMGIPVFANSDTARAIYENIGDAPKFKIFSTGEKFEFGDIEFDPFSIQHDAMDPVAFTLRLDSIKLGICADLGFATSLVANKLQECDYLYLEANHQVEMVHSCPRPAIYKQRVLGRLGHLSNVQAAELLLQLLHPKLKHVHLAHLSSECNVPELAEKTIREMLSKQKAEVEVAIAHQDQVSHKILW